MEDFEQFEHTEPIAPEAEHKKKSNFPKVLLTLVLAAVLVAGSSVATAFLM